MLGRFLEKKGYTSHAPHYKGHGVPPEELVHTGPEDWWKDVMDGYEHLKGLGYEKSPLRASHSEGIFIEIRLHCTCKGYCPNVCSNVYKKRRSHV